MPENAVTNEETFAGFMSRQAKDLSFNDLEKTVGDFVDGLTKALQAIDTNPLLRWAVPQEYIAYLDKAVKLAVAIDNFLHKTP